MRNNRRISRIGVLLSVWICAWACKASGTENMPVESTEPVSAMDTEAGTTEAAGKETLPENTTRPEGTEPGRSTDGAEQTETEAVSMVMKIDGQTVEVTWEDNAAVEKLKELASDGLTIEMSMYGGFEQVGPIGQKLPASDRQITTQAGDVILYAGDKLVVFYGSNSWAYTKLGKIDKSAREMKDLLGDHDVTIEIFMGTP